MKYTIRTGTHRAWPWSFRLWYKKKYLARKVYFDNSCKYIIEGDDMNDVNKLIGIGYFPHHKNSARFGWRHNPDTDKIKLSAYVYDQSFADGKPQILDLCDVSIYKWYHLLIGVFDNKYSFEVRESANGQVPGWRVIGYTTMKKTHTNKWSYRLGIWFGGNLPSPKEITIELKK